jgi:hypothetical protein
MRTGIATMTLDWGKCPRWLFERMSKLARGISIAIIEEFGPEEYLKRLADPIWFQSFGCVLAFDWNASGLTTTVLGALKDGIRGLESDLGIFICGGKGKTSKKTPQNIEDWGRFLGFSLAKIDQLVEASKMSAKVDNTVLQDSFQLYHHNLIFTKNGQWCVVQQGMNTEIKKARRYHWLSSQIKDFIEEPHSGIASQVKVKPLDLTAKQSRNNRRIATELVKDGPRTFLRDIDLIQKKKQGQLTLIEVPNLEFHHHPVEQEKFDLRRLKKTIFLTNQFKPGNFEELIKIKGVGPRTVRALSLVSEIIYGAKPSYQDPARYSFAHGGKDFVPEPVNVSVMDRTIDILEKGIKRAKIRATEKNSAIQRLQDLTHNINMYKHE